jgi:hypothetical protein
MIPGKAYTEPGFIAAEPGLFDDPLRFTFSPLIPEERGEHLDKVDAVTGTAKKQQVYAALMAERIKTWALVDGHGDAVELRPANILRLKPALFSRLYAIVLGVQASDLDPQWEPEKKQATTEDEYESALSGEPVCNVAQESLEKN